MLKQLFRSKAENAAADGSLRNGISGTGLTGHAGFADGSSFNSLKAAVEADRVEEASRGHRTPVTITGAGMGGDRRTSAELESCEEIYRNVPVKAPKVAYASLGILRVVDMVHSPHLAGMTPEAKRNSVLMALEAVGIRTEDLLQDAMVRQRALNEYEESQQAKLRDFEASKAQENAAIRAELDRLSAAHQAKIQENLDLIARHQDNFRVWTKRKEQESEQIAEAALLCTPQTAVGSGSLTATVTRFGADAVVGKSSGAAAAGKR